MSTRDEYVNAYRSHYRSQGYAGSGTGEYERKLGLWYRIGYEDWMTVLDYGCGWGAMVRGIKDTSLYMGVDIAPEAVDLARQRHPNVRFESFEMGQLDHPPVDFVAAQSVFTHARREDVADCLGDIRQVMKPESIAIIDVLHTGGNDSLLLRHYQPDDWLATLNASGLEGTAVEVIEWPTATHTYYKVTVA